MGEMNGHCFNPQDMLDTKNAKLILQLDMYPVHFSKLFRDFITTMFAFILLLFIPPGTTSKLQVADTVANRPFKHSITQAFNMWTADRVTQCLAAGEEAVAIRLKFGVPLMREKTAEWQMDAHAKLVKMEGAIISGYASTGLLRAFESSFQLAALEMEDTLFPNGPKDTSPPVLIGKEPEPNFDEQLDP